MLSTVVSLVAGNKFKAIAVLGLVVAGLWLLTNLKAGYDQDIRLAAVSEYIQQQSAETAMMIGRVSQQQHEQLVAVKRARNKALDRVAALNRRNNKLIGELDELREIDDSECVGVADESWRLLNSNACAYNLHIRGSPATAAGCEDQSGVDPSAIPEPVPGDPDSQKP